MRLITLKDVSKIQQLARDGLSVSEIAIGYNISEEQVEGYIPSEKVAEVEEDTRSRQQKSADTRKANKAAEEAESEDTAAAAAGAD